MTEILATNFFIKISSCNLIEELFRKQFSMFIFKTDVLDLQYNIVLQMLILLYILKSNS